MLFLFRPWNSGLNVHPCRVGKEVMGVHRTIIAFKDFNPHLTKARAIFPIICTKSTLFSMWVGLCQDCTLSQILFVVLTNKILR